MTQSPHKKTVDIAITPHPFAAARVLHQIEAGASIAAIVAELQPAAWLARHAHVYMDGDYIPRDRWNETVPAAGAALSIRLVPAGGGGRKNPLRTVLSLAVMAATPYLAGSLSGFLGAGSFMGLNIGRGIVAGVNLLGKLALNALAPPPKPRFSGTAKESQTLFIQGARNQAFPFGRVPKVLGKHRFVPPLGALPYTETVGNDQYIRMLFVWGYGPLEISDLKIGETPLTEFTEVQIETRKGYDDDAPITLYSNSVIQNDLQVVLTEAAGYITRTTELDADEISVDITLPRGLLRVDNKGNRLATLVKLDVQYSPKNLDQWSAGSGSWLSIGSQIIGGILRPDAYVYRGVTYATTRFDRIVLDPASGEARLIQGPVFRTGLDTGTPEIPAVPSGSILLATIERRSGDAAVIPGGRITDGRSAGLFGGAFEDSGDFAVTAAVSSNTVAVAAGGLKMSAIEITGKQSAAIRRSVSFKVPRGQYDVRVKRINVDAVDENTFDETLWTALRTIRYAEPVTMPGLAMTALRIKATDQLNGVIDRFNGVVHSILPDWNGSDWVEQVTSNPASLFRHVLQGSANARPLADSRLDLQKLQDWHDVCADAGREFNAVIDYDISVREVLQDIAATGRASPTLIDGKWAVVEDKPQTVPIQHFTPRNTFGFRGEKAFDDNPDALRVRFINRDNGWLQDERLVFDDGFDAETAEKYETLELPGVTSTDQAWKDGRYHIATARLRPELYSFYTDVEHIVCTRGDLIRFTHDVTLHGLGSARVKSVATAGGNATGITVDAAFTMEVEADKEYSVRFRKADGSSLLKEVVKVAGRTQVLEFKEPFDEEDAPAAGDLVMFGESGSESVELIVKSIEPQSDLTARITCVDYAPAVHTADVAEIPPFNSQITVPIELKRPPEPVLSSVQSDEAVLIRNADGSFIPSVIVSLAPTDFPLPLSLSAQMREADESEFFPTQCLSGDRQLTIVGVEAGKIYDFKIIHKNPAGVSSQALLIAGHTVIGDSGLPSDVENFTLNTLAGTAYLSWEAADDVDLSHYRIRFNNAVEDANWSNSIDLVAKVARPATTVAVPAALGTYLIKAVDRSGRESENETLIVSKVSAIADSLDVATFSEDPDFPGSTLINTEIVSDTLRLTVDPDTHTYETEGLYYCDTVIDFGRVYTTALSADLTATGAHLAGTMDDWDNVDLVESWDNTADPSDWGVKILVSQTDDDPEDDPEWSNPREFIIGEYSARALSFIVVLNSNQAGVTPVVSGLSIAAHMQMCVQSGNDVTSVSTDTPTVVSFDAPFHTFNALTITAQSMATGDYYTITNPTEEGFEIIFKNAAGTRITRTFDYIATGFGR